MASKYPTVDKFVETYKDTPEYGKLANDTNNLSDAEKAKLEKSFSVRKKSLGYNTAEKLNREQAKSTTNPKTTKTEYATKQEVKKEPPPQEASTNSQKVDPPPTATKDNVEATPLPSTKANFQLFDIVKDYDWTYSERKDTDSIPYLELKEYHIIANSQVSSLITSMMLVQGLKDSYKDAANDAKELASFLTSGIADDSSGLKKQFMNGNDENAKTAKDLAETKDKKAKEQMDMLKELGDNEWQDWPEDMKDQYKYLYLRKSTNTKYKFPFFNSDYFNFKNDFSESYNGPQTGLGALISNTLTKSMDALVDTLNPAALTEPGTYIQRPKFYSFKGEEPEFTFSFYLFNTLNSSNSNELPFIKNTKLIARLVAKNTPVRRNRLVVEPPCIYELTIPGRGFYPYVCISSLRIEHVGTRRILTVPTSVSDGKSTSSSDKKMIIPDAFKLTITLKSLTTEAFNFIVPQLGADGINIKERHSLASIIKDKKQEKQQQKEQQKQEKKKQEKKKQEEQKKAPYDGPNWFNLGRAH